MKYSVPRMTGMQDLTKSKSNLFRQSPAAVQRHGVRSRYHEKHTLWGEEMQWRKRFSKMS